MNPMKKTKTLIVTETVRYEFEVPASMPEDETRLKRFFGKQPDPWIGADFAAVTQRDFVVESPWNRPTDSPSVDAIQGFK